MPNSIDIRMPSPKYQDPAPAQSQPLGALLIFKRDTAWFEANPGIHNDFDPENTRILKHWERRLGGKIYKLYGFEWSGGETWEFFTLLEFADLEVWQRFQNQLDQTGFSDHFTWEIVALGRGMG